MKRRHRHSWLVDVASSISLVAIAIGLRVLIQPIVGDRVPFIFMFPVVFGISWYVGRRAALIAILLGALTTYFVFSAPVENTVSVYWTSLVMFVMVSVPLTELTLATRTARARHLRAAERLDLALTTADVGVWEWDFATSSVWWSDSLESVYQLPLHTFDPTLEVFLQLIHNDDRSRVEHVMRASIVTSEHFSTEFRLRNAERGRRWMSATGKVYCDANGRAVRMVGTCRDSTARHMAAEAASRFDAVMTHAPVIVYTKDREGRYLTVNRLFAELTQTSAGQLIGRTDAELFGPRAPSFRAMHDAVLSTGEPQQCERVVHYAGKAMTLLMVNFPLRDDHDQTIVGVGAIANDISARKEAEAALHEADRRKDEFLAILAHELRNPLAPIRIGVEMLELDDETSQGVAAKARSLAIMKRQLSHLVRLIDDLCDVNRIRRGKLELRRSRTTLVEVAQAALETAGPSIASARHELVVELPERPVELHVDATRIAQVICNGLVNAAKYTPRGGKIKLVAQRRGDELVITIHDSGIGISREHLPRVFDMFAQVAPANSRSQGGLGIGLALARALVEMHGGTIAIDSPGEKLGSTLTLCLPLEKTAALPVVIDATDHPTLRRAANLRVLVADDNHDVSDTLSMFLKTIGHTVQVASDGAEAVAAATRFQPDVAVLDIGMPNMDGYEAARRMRRLSEGRPLVLIAVSGWGQPDDLRKSREAGFDYHLTKPVQPQTLIELVSSATPPTAAP